MSCYIYVLHFTLYSSKPSHILKYIWLMISCSRLLNLYLNSTLCVHTTSRLYVGCKISESARVYIITFCYQRHEITRLLLVWAYLLLFTYLKHFIWDSLDGISTRAENGRPGNRSSIPARGTYIFLVHKASRLAVAPHSLLLKWVSRRAFCRGKGAGCKFTNTKRLV